MRRQIVFQTGILILGFILLLSANLFGGDIRGRIVDIETGKTLPGVNVQLLGTVRGSSTDGNGVFIIPNIPPGNYSLRASMISYKTQVKDNVIVSLERDAEVDFQLKETPIEFDPIVVLGGKNKQRMDRVPVSLSVVTSSEIRTRNATNLIDALESAPGIHFIGCRRAVAKLCRVFTTGLAATLHVLPAILFHNIHKQKISNVSF